MKSTFVYITKHALTSGIIKRRGYITAAGFFFDSSTGSYYQRNEYCLTLPDAKRHAEIKRRMRIEQLQGQITWLQNLTFSTPTLNYQ